MKEQAPSFGEGYNEHKKWVREFAEKHEVGLDEGAEHFVIPYKTDDGEERRVYIRSWKNIPLGDENGKIAGSVPIKEAIEAVKKYPGVPFPEAVKRFRSSSTSSE